MPVKKIDSATLKQWLDLNKVVVIDVREPGEHKTQKIYGSYNTPLGQVSIDSLPELQDKKVVIHCHSGRRSSMACESLLKQDPNIELYELEGGISSWVAKNLPTESLGKKVIPIDRQVQVVVGVLLIIFAVLSLLVNSNFVILVLLIGCGLLFAGFSGSCMMAVLLAKMPWNK